MPENTLNEPHKYAEPSSEEKPSALSVSAALAQAKEALEHVVVRILGEVSEVSDKQGYKAVYFTIKDADASLPCMMWNNRYRASGIKLTQGMLVELTGRFSLYTLKGRMNFDVFSLNLAGEGNLRLQVANLAKKLQAEGLTDPSRKRSIPFMPQTIGLVTSPRGAAVHDVLRTLRRRFPLARVVVAGVPVEGASAPEGITEALRCLSRAEVEVILLVRGGGSFEDLMPFNDEGLARAIAASPVPIVTGIGHEPDTSIADMVADMRASTPTAAAEAVSPSRESLNDLFSMRSKALSSCMQRCIERESMRVRSFAQRPLFCDTSFLFAQDAQTIDRYADHLSRALPANIERDCICVKVAASRIKRAFPHAFDQNFLRLYALRDRMSVCGQSLVAPFSTTMNLAAARLHDLSPLAILGRGYSITRTTDTGDVVKLVSQVRSGSDLTVAVSDGEIDCCVKDVRRINTAAISWKE